MNGDIEQRQIYVLVLSALMTAIVLTTTLFTKIDMSIGYLNLGDLVIMIITVIAPFKIAIVAAGLGSAMADLFSGYAIYFFFTFFIKMGEVIIIHYLMKKEFMRKWVIIPFLSAGMFMVSMYGGADVIISSDINYFGASMIGNLPQGIVSAGIATVLYPQYIRMKKYLRGS